jgi:polar amino acid transport system permease protein
MSIFFHQYFDLDIIRDNFSYVLQGFGQTLLLSAVGGVLSMTWGLVLALLRASPGRPMMPVRGLTIAYIDVMRGIPLLLVILLISGSIPFLTFLPQTLRAPDFFGKPDIFWFGIFALTLTYGAYYAEVYRAGLDGVPYGQTEAARSLGMSHAQSMRHVIVPQAIRRVIPPMLNDFIALMKDTSLIQVIGLVEVVRAGREVQAETFNSSALTLGALMFVVVTIPLARLVDRLIARQQAQTRRVAPV